MMFYDYYADAPEDAVDGLVRDSPLGRLVTVGDDLMPHVGLYPFVVSADRVELHMNKRDEQVADLRERSSCVFEVDDVLGTVPSHWFDPEHAGFATAYHRSVVLECAGVVVDDPAEIARQQGEIMARYQPEGRHRQVDAGDPLYAPMLGMIVAIQLTVIRRRAKFKLGQNRDFETRRTVAAKLRERGGRDDDRMAEALEWTIGLDWTTEGRRA